MSSGEQNRENWRKRFEAAIEPLASSVTAVSIGHQRFNFGNAALWKLGEYIDKNPEIARLMEECYASTDVDAGEIIDLVVGHPDVGAVFDGQGHNTATWVLSPSQGCRVELRHMAAQFAMIAAVKGNKAAAAKADRFLTLVGEGEIPGYEVAVIYGLEVEGLVSLGPGTFISSFGVALRNGLVRKRMPEPMGSTDPDHEANRASVISRKISWKPCLVRPSELKGGPFDPTNEVGPLAQVNFEWSSGPSLGVILDSLSLATKQHVRLVEILFCAPDFADINPSFTRGSSRGFIYKTPFSVQKMMKEQASQIREWLQSWTKFNGEDHMRLELGLARLTSSTQRGQNRFSLEDRILDIAVALEVFYGLDGSELTHKLSTRVAYFLCASGSGQDRIQLFDAVKELYAFRSKIIHGTGMGNQAKARQAREIAENGYDIGRRTLIELLGRTDMPDWNRVTLSAEQP